MAHRVQRCPIAPWPLLTIEAHSKIIKKRQCGRAGRLNDYIFNVCYHNYQQPPHLLILLSKIYHLFYFLIPLHHRFGFLLPRQFGLSLLAVLRQLLQQVSVMLQIVKPFCEVGG